MLWDCGPRFAAAVQHEPASAKVSSNSSGNKYTYAAGAKAARWCSEEDDTSFKTADSDSSISISASHPPCWSVHEQDTESPTSSCTAVTDPAVWPAEQPRKGEFPWGDQISHYYYSSMLLISHLLCSLQSHTMESHISVSLEQDVCVCVCMRLHRNMCVFNHAAPYHPPSSWVEGLWFLEKHFT